MRIALAAFAALTLLIAWLGPVRALVAGPFAAHMTVHMAVVAIAAPLAALSVSGSRLDPAAWAPAWFAAVPASVLELVVVWAWHTPALHHLARHSATGLAAEQSTFLLSGLYVWLAALGGPDGSQRQRAAAGVVALLLTSMHMTLLGALLALSPRPLFSHGPLDAALSDQHLGGAIMLLVGGIAYLAGGLGLSVRLVRQRARRAEPSAFPPDH